jgi:hypothetical protein
VPIDVACPNSIIRIAFKDAMKSKLNNEPPLVYLLLTWQDERLEVVDPYISQVWKRLTDQLH